jgi:hypothetical protein
VDHAPGDHDAEDPYSYEHVLGRALTVAGFDQHRADRDEADHTALSRRPSATTLAGSSRTARLAVSAASSHQIDTHAQTM